MEEGRTMRRENTMEQHDSTEALLCDACRRIPISHLSLDVSEPLVGWEVFFEERYITVMDDSLGRPSVARHVLGDLIAEQREREARLVEEAAEKEATLKQPVGAGVPALEGAGAFESLMAASNVSPQQEFGGRPRPRFLEEQLEAGARQQAAEQEAVRRRKEAR
jgi:hypothetical protein